MDLGRALAALLLLGPALIPPRWLATSPPLCPSRWLGRRCPGCGLTRALSLLLHGRARAAVATHPGVLIVAPLLVWLVLAGEVRLAPRQRRLVE